MSDETSVQSEGGGAGASYRTPPYISFLTLINFLKALKTEGVPPQIDKSVLSKLSGGTQAQLKMALRSLGLMDGDKPTDALQAIVDAFETPTFETLLTERLKATYPYVFALDLMTATPTMFADAFKVTGAKEDVLRKCRTFFLHAAKRAGLPIGNRIATGSVPRSTNGGTKRRTKSKPAAETETQSPPVQSTHAGHHVISDKAMEYKLVDLMKEDGIGDNEQAAIWTLIRYLTTRNKKNATDHI